MKHTHERRKALHERNEEKRRNKQTHKTEENTCAYKTTKRRGIVVRHQERTPGGILVHKCAEPGFLTRVEDESRGHISHITSSSTPSIGQVEVEQLNTHIKTEH